MARPAADGLVILMLGAVVMHVKVRDPMAKSAPTLIMLVMCLVVALAQTTGKCGSRGPHGANHPAGLESSSTKPIAASAIDAAVLASRGGIRG